MEHLERLSLDTNLLHDIRFTEGLSRLRLLSVEHNPVNGELGSGYLEGLLAKQPALRFLNLPAPGIDSFINRGWGFPNHNLVQILTNLA